MSKNELHVIARIVLIVTGLYVFLSITLNILSSLALLPLVAPANRGGILMIPIVLGIYAIIAAVAVYFLTRCANRFSDKIAEHEHIEDTQISAIPVAFRLACVINGVLLLYWSVPNLIITVFNYIWNMNTTNKSGMRTISITEIAKYVIMLGIGIYFAYGAPGFVRWQVRMTLKQCGKIQEQKPTLG